MQILLANAKIMFDKADRAAVSKPLFQSVAEMLAAEMAKLDVEELARQLDCSHKIASENWKRYRNFMAAVKMPAILSYNGQAYKHLRANTLGEESLQYAQKHLWITCFLYGLLRPMDGRLKMQAVWAKSCRGAMVRYILSNQLATPEELAAFSYEGFEYAPELGEAAFPHFVRNITK